MFDICLRKNITSGYKYQEEPEPQLQLERTGAHCAGWMESKRLSSPLEVISEIVGTSWYSESGQKINGPCYIGNRQKRMNDISAFP